MNIFSSCTNCEKNFADFIKKNCGFSKFNDIRIVLESNFSNSYHSLTFPGDIGPISLAVLMFIGYKQTPGQPKYIQHYSAILFFGAVLPFLNVG